MVGIAFLIFHIRSHLRLPLGMLLLLQQRQKLLQGLLDIAPEAVGCGDGLAQLRTIDIDMIDYEGVVSDDPGLILPHPRARERDFVMEPLKRLGIAF